MTAKIAQTPTQHDTDEQLRRVYGDDAKFSRVGAFTLVHLDGASAEEIERRAREFDPGQYFFDDCPLCVAAKASGGHVVFDAAENDPLRSNTDNRPLSEQVENPSPAVRFDTGMVELAEAIEELHRRVKLTDAVGHLDELFIEALWAEDPPRRVIRFEDLARAAADELARVRAEQPELGERVERVERAIGAVARVWRSL
jgi:hypothetical protein